MNGRLGWLLLGCLIGFVIGYIVRSLRELKEGVAQVDEHVTHPKNDSGFARGEWLNRICLLLVVALTVYAAFTSQYASNNVKKSQNSQVQTTKCIRIYLTETIVALNERTTFTLEGNRANVDLQAAFSKIVELSLRKPPPTNEEGRKAVEDYALALNHFLDVSNKSNGKVLHNPYPTPEELQNCISH